MLNPGVSVLRGRYSLARALGASAEFELWQAQDEYGGPVLIKAWPYSGARPDEVLRALWDVELRNLFRLSSSPESESQIVILKEAGIDYDLSHFVMALACPGITPLENLILDRKHQEWLRDLKSLSVRASLWKGLRGIAAGLAQLHQQQMLHRNISAEAVFLAPELGPESMRLGGFEWTVRLGAIQSASGRTPAVVAPEVVAKDAALSGHSFESDWFAFGALVARVIGAAEPELSKNLSERYTLVLKKIQSNETLLDIEKDLLLRLLIHAPDARLSRGYEVITAVDDVISRLNRPARLMQDSYLGLVVLLGPARPLSRAIQEQDDGISAVDIERQRKFVEADLESPKLVRRHGAQEAYILVGNRLSYSLTEHSDLGTPHKGDWSLGFCGGDAQLRFAGGGGDQRELRQLPIRVFSSMALMQNATAVRKGAVSWLPFLPRADRYAVAQERQQRFHEFFRVTNQLELLFRDAEIFPYQMISSKQRDGVQEVVIVETTREREVPPFARMSGGLPEFLRRQQVEKAEGDLVYLGPEDGLFMARRVDRTEFWEIVDIVEDGSQVRLKRLGTPSDGPPQKGFLRSFDLFGQMKLIQRRKRAIERLRQHTYLLQALQSPSYFYIDTGASTLPLPIDPTKVDDAKREALENIWRTRPIFALQGPPGTGKTTLVANLLGQVFADDPVAQVLVTAQAHAAVDVLREKVTTEIFGGAAEGNRPLSIRLTKSGTESEDDVDSVHNVTLRMMQRAKGSIQQVSEIEKKWAEVVRAAVSALQRGDREAGAGDLCELVRRSANITYSTTTAGNLEELADMTQSFDWSLIEEAGKAHGFDLALPLQTGHRWLLIGDQNQLPPYRYSDFEQALRYTDDAVDRLWQLPERAGGLVDVDFLSKWRALEETEKEERRNLWLRWLPLFRELYRTCYEATETKGENGSTQAAVLAYMLHRQHRMHPTIADLISKAYYRGRIKSETVDPNTGSPLDRVKHPFVAPAALKGRPLIWINVPWVKNKGAGEVGPMQGKGAYTAPDEVHAILRFVKSLGVASAWQGKLRMAVLSPYRLQVFALSRALESLYNSPPAWLRPAEDKSRAASTVDSFQGDQADIVIVSLVRNNDFSPGSGLGFLQESSRMNVLFSRAERLLVLVGSWDFFKHQVSTAPPDPDQPLGHWRLAMDYIEERKKIGDAYLMDVRELTEPHI